MSDLRDRLAAELARGPVEAALVAARLPAAADEAARIADDASADLALRVAALLAVALAVDAGAPMPTVDLLGDDLLVDAAIAADCTAALTLLARDDAQRRYIALRLAAAGATGAHVAALHLSLGELERAAAAFTPCLTIEPHAAHVLLAIEWVDAHGVLLARLLADRIPPPMCALFAELLRSIGAPHQHALLALVETRALTH